MGVSAHHILRQGAALGALGRTAFAALKQQLGAGASGPVTTPGPEVRRTLAPLPAGLVREYVLHVGGDPAAYRGVLPPHLYCQWAFPLAAQTLIGVPYPMARVMNAGTNFTVHEPLPSGEPLEATARLESIDDDGRRALMKVRTTTGVAGRPDLLTADFFAIVPLGRSRSKRPSGKGDASRSNGAPRPEKKDKPRVPHDVREIAFWNVSRTAGLDFAKLTGDFNPLHWIAPYAKASGFRNVILHGFATMARAYEGLARGALAGDALGIAAFDVRFTRPLVLPAKVGLYVREQEVFVGDLPGGPAYLTGTFRPRDRHGDDR